MIDWLTLVLDLPEHLWARCALHASMGKQIQCIDPISGEIDWSTPARESVRSDTHQITVQISGSRVRISGSPARSMGLPNNVWGSDNLADCARAHVRLVQRMFPGLALPGPSAWNITRVDVTHNYDFGSLAEVRQALGYLRQFDGGRYRVDTRRGETVYWSPGSTLRGGKAYAKGPHLRYQCDKGQARASVAELALAERLLRMELRLGGAWWRRLRADGRKQWAVDLQAEFHAYWSGLIGRVEVAEMGELECLKRVAPSEGQALAAYRTWALVKAIGHREASDSMPRATWYRHKNLLNRAGLGWGDLATGQVVQFRRRALELREPVHSWEELRRAA
ncbi:MAG: phage/plasmid replication protein, II/X family [Magnetococcus sp. WYHC-3]